MADPNFSWIYLIIFLAIPLSRIIPRLIAKRKMQNLPQQRKFEQDELDKKTQETKLETRPQKPQSNEKVVLRELNQGVKRFENIQKNTGLNRKELDRTLENLENNGFMKVVHKQGLFGHKIELYPTNKGLE